jgi:hypothetical protein
MLTPSKLLHLNGPLPQPRNLLFRYVTEQIRHRRVPGSVVYFWRKASTNGNLNHSRCHHRNALTLRGDSSSSPKAFTRLRS